MQTPILKIMGGPNGSGKSTVTAGVEIAGDYINADNIQKHLKCDPLTAAQSAEALRESLLQQRKDFTFESVLSTPRNYNLMMRAKQAGYRVICIYVLTKNPEINVSRVAARHRNGGHDVPPDKVRERYYRAMKLFPRLFYICDELYVYDNSPERTQGEPHRIISMRNGNITVSPNNVWSIEMIKELCKGRYLQQ